MTEQEIFKGIANKNNTTFLYLYEKYKGQIINMVHKNSGTNEDALDVFQEGIIALWTNISLGKYQLKENVRISSYLFALCRNIWISKLRKRKIVKEIDDNDSLVDPIDINALEDEYDQVKDLANLFKKLGNSCKRLLDLFYFQKSSLKEIALQMEITEKTAKNNKYRCMQSLRQLYNTRSTAL